MKGLIGLSFSEIALYKTGPPPYNAPFFRAGV